VKRLRPWFLHDRRLLGMLCRVAYETLREFLNASIGESAAVPGVVASIQTFGTLELAPSPSPRRNLRCLSRRRHVRAPLLPRSRDPHGGLPKTGAGRVREGGPLHPETADSMLAWPHSGFHVHHHVRIDADDEKGRAQIARYAARAPVALCRMTYDAEEGIVRIVSDKSDGPTAGTHTFEPLEFLARLLAHVPRKSEIYVRYYGAYSVRRRAAWRERGIRPGRRLPEEPIEPVPEAVRARRRRWAELL
jgi:hypothetical protein